MALKAKSLKKTLILLFLLGPSAFAQFMESPSDPSVERGLQIAQSWTRAAEETSETTVPIDPRRDTRLLLFFNSANSAAIVHSGFLNQHQTGSSRGSLLPEVRAQLEDLMARAPLESKYNPSPDSPVHQIRPKYLTVEVMTEQPTKIVVNDAAEFLMYGTAIAVLKEDVKNRTTFQFGDSLATHGPTVMKGQRPPDLHLQNFYQSSLYVPKGNRVYPYIEGQVWGALRASDVESLMVYKKQAKTETLAALKAFQLPIYSYDIVDHDELGYRIKKGDLLWQPPKLQTTKPSGEGFHVKCEAVW